MNRLFKAIPAILLLFCAPLRADDLFGEFKRVPDEIERGFSIGADFGLFYLTGDKGQIKDPGFSLSFVTGYDILKYFALEGVYTMGINEANPNTLGGGVNTFIFSLAGKAQYPFGRLYVFGEAGPGVHYSNPNLSAETTKISVLLAGGLEYYTYLRHYSAYLKTSYFLINRDLADSAITISLGLKYTF